MSTFHMTFQKSLGPALLHAQVEFLSHNHRMTERQCMDMFSGKADGGEYGAVEDYNDGGVEEQKASPPPRPRTSVQGTDKLATAGVSSIGRDETADSEGTHKRKRPVPKIFMIQELSADSIATGLNVNVQNNQSVEPKVSVLVWSLGVRGKGTDLDTILRGLKERGCLSDRFRVLLFKGLPTSLGPGGGDLWRPEEGEPEHAAAVTSVRDVLKVRTSRHALPLPCLTPAT